MITAVESKLTFELDPANPGQFFACCGLLEFAARLWRANVVGAFQDGGRTFSIKVPAMGSDSSREHLIRSIASCSIGNTMSADEVRRLDELGAMRKQEIEDAGREDEKKALESLRREAPVVFGEPFSITIDWHQDDRAGGSAFKTWAGQQSIIDIARGMQELGAPLKGPAEAYLWRASRGGGLPFNFDSDLGGQGAALDVGFSFDPLPDMKVGVRPAIELCAFVGLERFRPQRHRRNRYRYCAWSEFLPPSVASAAACGLARAQQDPVFEFRLLYRTKYLKSFLPAQRVRGEQ